MSGRQQAVFWMAAAGSFLATLILFEDVLLPFVVGLAVAYFLDPVVDYLEERGLPRSIGASIIMGGFGLIVIATLLLIIPVLKIQFLGMAQGVAEGFGSLQESFPDALEDLQVIVGENALNEGKQALLGAGSNLISWILHVLGGAWRSGAAFINIIGLLVLTPVLAWYLLRDWDRLISKIDDWLPREHQNTIREQAKLIDEVLASFVRGQATVCLIMAIAYAVSLELVGLKHGLLVGLLAGLTSFIPYVGAALGFIIATVLAYLQFGESSMIILIVSIFVVGQLVEGNFLTPKLVGDRVGLHAVWIVFSLLAGGSLFGFVGVLIAVPVAAVVGVLSRFLLKVYLGSTVYSKTRSDQQDNLR